jgi:hypothetical protein
MHCHRLHNPDNIYVKLHHTVESQVHAIESPSKLHHSTAVTSLVTAVIAEIHSLR